MENQRTKQHSNDIATYWPFNQLEMLKGITVCTE